MSNIHVGNPPSDWEGWESRLIHFHDFAALPFEKNKPTWSPIFTCFDNDWKVVLYSGGFGETSGVISLYLQHCSETDISVIFFLSVKDKTNETSVGSSNECMKHKFCQADKTCGHEKFATRSSITQSNILEYGTLTVELRFKLDNKGDDDHYQQFIPKNRFVQNMKQLFLDQDRQISPLKWEIRYSLLTSSCYKPVPRDRFLPPSVTTTTAMTHLLYQYYQTLILKYFG
jgi:hypothetical protein